MEDCKKKICELCLGTINDDRFEILDENKRYFIEVLLLKLNLANKPELVICNICSIELLAAFEFKSMCIYTNNTVISYITSEMVPVDLKVIYFKEKVDEGTFSIPDELKICRLCMEPIYGGSIPFQDVDINKIRVYIPEVNFEASNEPVMCMQCVDSVNVHSSFLTNCLTGQERTKNICAVNDCQTEELGECTKIDPDKLKLEKVAQEDGMRIKTEDGIKLEGSDPRKVSEFHGVFIKSEEIDSYEKSSSGLFTKNDEVVVNSEQDVQEVELPDAVDESRLKETEEQQSQTSRIDFENKVMTYCNTSEKLRSDCKSTNKAKNSRAIVKSPKSSQKYKCRICDYQTKYKNCLVSHQLKHKDTSEVQMYKCNECDYQTKYKGSLVPHQLKHRDVSEVHVYKCEECHYQTKYKGHLFTHHLKHRDASEVRMFKCDQCEYQTKYKGHLGSHQLMHRDASEVQMFKCDFCGYQTKHKPNLVSHQLKHKDGSEVPIYKCTRCDYQAIHKGRLVSHQLKHRDASEVRMFKCDICDFQTKYKHNLAFHQLKHTDASKIQMFKCDGCEYQTKYKGTLVRHKLTHKNALEVQKDQKNVNVFL